jgi:seryl-tRNA synthetase
MLDLADFISDRGGNPNKIKESQRKRFAPEEVVDEVIALYEAARRGMSSAMKIPLRSSLLSTGPLGSAV